mmetsp:Transcript_17007/g.23945  ORF Transcript_17007/g.23945 Transcript_17007/m.23945 type:complete len:585 (-) Transcript_17007:137-1891(-)
MKIVSLALSFLCLTGGIVKVSAVEDENDTNGLRGGGTSTTTTKPIKKKLIKKKLDTQHSNSVAREAEAPPDYVESDKNNFMTKTSSSAIELMQGPKQIQGVESRRVIVRYEPGQRAKFIRSMKIAERQRTPGQPEMKVNYDFSNRNTYVITADPTVVKSLESMPEVMDIKDDVIRYPFSSSPDLGLGLHNNDNEEDETFPFSSYEDESTRRDLKETMPYGVKMVKAPEVWKQGYAGENVKICVIDSGLHAGHRDFITTKLDGIDTPELNWDEDGCGHGTHVTGTIVGEDNDEGVIGVAPQAEILTVRVFGNNCNWAYASDIYNAATVCYNNGANIISMSLGGPTREGIEAELFEELANNGVMSIAAAGNSGNNRLMYPASYESVMSVAAVSRWKRHAGFSQRNEQIDIAAPGVRVLSTFPDRCKICGFLPIFRGYGWIDGTSMACPHVSGVAALLMSAKPDATVTEVREAIEKSAEDLGKVGRDNMFGHGLINAEAALAVLMDDSSTSQRENPTSLTKTRFNDHSNTCTDFPLDWHDANGSTYNCSWYDLGTNCQLYGDGFESQGFTANEACCACGGGVSAAEP